MDYDRMTERDWYWTMTIIICCASIAIFQANKMSISTANILLLSLIAALILAYCLYWFLTIPTDKRIIRKLNNMGYKSYLNEGTITFQRLDGKWTISTWIIKKRFRRVSFNIGFTDNDLDKDHALTNKIFCIIVSRNRQVTLVWNGTNTYACSFYTVFTSTNDIEREFKTAMAVIDDTLNELYTLFRQAFQQQPIESEHKIGFHVRDDESSDEDMPSEIRAQIET